MLQSPIETQRLEAMHILRSQIDRLVMVPNGDGLSIEVFGNFMGILGATGARPDDDDYQTPEGGEVPRNAGARNQRFLRLAEWRIPKLAA